MKLFASNIFTAIENLKWQAQLLLLYSFMTDTSICAFFKNKKKFKHKKQNAGKTLETFSSLPAEVIQPG